MVRVCSGALVLITRTGGAGMGAEGTGVSATLEAAWLVNARSRLVETRLVCRGNGVGGNSRLVSGYQSISNTNDATRMISDLRSMKATPISAFYFLLFAFPVAPDRAHSHPTDDSDPGAEGPASRPEPRPELGWPPKHR